MNQQNPSPPQAFRRSFLLLVLGALIITTAVATAVSLRRHRPRAAVPASTPSSNTQVKQVGPQASVNRSERDVSALDVSIEPNGAFLITDEAGRATGTDPQTGERLENIPRSTYFQDRIGNEVGRSVQIDQPQAGVYTIVVRALPNGMYSLFVRVFATNGASQPELTAEGQLTRGSEARFLLNLNTASDGRSTLAALPTTK